MQQYIDNVWQPLSFFSKKLNPAETRYSAFDCELLAVYATIRHFRHNLEGRNFFRKYRQQTFNFCHVISYRTPITATNKTVGFYSVKGETNFVADALSRPSVSVKNSTSAINYKELSADQALDAELTQLRHSTSFTMNFQLLKSFDNHLIWCDVSTGHNWPYITVNFEKMFS